MWSAVRLHEKGKEIWSVSHASWKDKCNLESSGMPPAQLAGIREEMLEKQREQDSITASGMSIYYVFDIPVMLAESICGHRHDLWRYDWGQPQFTIAKRE